MIIILIIAILIFITILQKLSKKEQFTDQVEIKNKIVYCPGCLDETGQCHPQVAPICTDLNNTVCYSFYDENGNLKSPCSLFDRNKKDYIKSCDMCDKCIMCIDKDFNENCVSKSIFDCETCPNSRICRESPFNIYIYKKK